MRVLIGYHDEACSDDSLDDLARAGLGDVDIEARVICVAPVTGIPPSPEFERRYPAMAWLTRERQESADAQAAETARSGAERLRGRHPQWVVEPLAVSGTTYAALIEAADRWPADLLVVGSHGRGVMGRLFHGSVAQMCVNNSRRSVRVARGFAGATKAGGGPVKVIVATDGSATAGAAVRAVARRRWPAGTKVLVAHVVDLEWVPDAVAAVAEVTAVSRELTEARQALHDRGREIAEAAVAQLAAAGLSASATVLNGRPRYALSELAERESATCIFLGAVGHRAAQRLLLGSVASAVAASAPCSVEIVRPEAAA